MSQSPFFWYELMTSDREAATAFYVEVVGWKTEPFGDPASPYVILKAGDTPVGGLMTIPPEAAAMGARPAWLGYIHAVDVDRACAELQAAGGAVYRPPSDIPTVGRFAVVADPHGAHFMLMAPEGEGGETAPAMAAGHVGWRELFAGDLDSAFDFYAGQFGWIRGDALDMGPMGTYQLFSSGPDQMGGMMTRPAEIPHPFWLFYFNVDAIDAAAARVAEHGGQVVMGPMEVPGGGWIIQGIDPQGAMFALAAQKR